MSKSNGRDYTIVTKQLQWADAIKLNPPLYHLNMNSGLGKYIRPNQFYKDLNGQIYCPRTCGDYTGKNTVAISEYGLEFLCEQKDATYVLSPPNDYPNSICILAKDLKKKLKHARTWKGINGNGAYYVFNIKTMQPEEPPLPSNWVSL